MEKKQKKFLPFPLILSSILLVILLAGYLIVSWYFNDHFFPNTTIGTIDCSGKTAEWATSQNLTTAEDFLFTIYDRDGNKYHLRGMDFSYSYENLGEEAAALKTQSSYAWPLELTKDHTYSLNAGFVYDSSQLAEQIKTLPIFDSANWISPENASIQITEDGYEIIPEVKGNIPIEEMVISEITNALNQGSTSITLTDNCYEVPEITENSQCITAAAQEIRTYSNSTIHYEIENVDENLTREQILSMLIIDENNEVSIDTRKIDQFVQSLATKYNTYGDIRDFHTSLGDAIRIGGGDYGWVIAKTKEAQQILIDLEGGSPVSREPVYEQTAQVSGLYDIGNTYIEVDYTNQHMWYYEEGSLILESDFVSGNINKGNGSPDGIFKVVYKQSPAVLRGEDYESDVTYFIPFAYNVGFHDASWRKNFGGEIYKKSGSHGCINMPLEAVQVLFEKAAVGTPVIAYYREETELTTENARISNAFSYVDPEKKKEAAELQQN